MDGKILSRKLGRKVGLIILIFTWSGLFAQSSTDNKANLTVSGVVIDARSNEPVNAAQISDLDNRASAVTDEKGNFTIQLTSLNSILRVVAYDYNPVEVSLRGENKIVIELFSDEFSNYFNNINTITGEKRNSAIVSSIKATGEVEKASYHSLLEAIPG